MKSCFGRINKLREAKNPRSLVLTLAQQVAPPRLPCTRIIDNKMVGRRNLILLCITICLLQVKCADKYTDENRPYEFGFTIDGEQHRHEKKDENGIIMGEFGFITADGVYHVTVYATDENGNFKILSMKNIRVKPYPTAKSGPERGRSLEFSSSPQELSKPSIPEQNKKQFKELPKPGPASPAKSCSHCKLPTTTTTTTQAPYIPRNNIAQVPSLSQEPEILPKQNQYEDKHTQKDVKAQSYLQQGLQQQQLQQEQQQQQFQQGQQQQPFQQGRQQQQLQQGGQQQQIQLQQGQQVVQQNKQGTQQQQQEQSRAQQQGIQQQEQQQNTYNNEKSNAAQEIGPAQNYPQSELNNEDNNAQQSYAKEGLQNYDYTKQLQHSEEQQAQQQQPEQYTNGSPQNYPTSEQNSNNNYPQQSYTQSGLGNNPTYQTGSGQINPGGKDEPYYAGGNIEPNQPQSLTSENKGQRLQSETSRTPKSYDNQSSKDFNALNSPASAFVAGDNTTPKKPQLISAQMQIVDKNTDIHYKRPGEKEGLPEGLTKDDMSQLLYTFNYTVGFHGHFEEGYKNGAKVGYYYVTGRNGVRTRVDYVADEKGFRPKITQEVLDLLSDDVPKPDTEKDPKYGLKGYEFKWLYYPVDT